MPLPPLTPPYKGGEKGEPEIVNELVNTYRDDGFGSNSGVV